MAITVATSRPRGKITLGELRENLGNSSNMNTKDFIRLGAPLGEATRRATDFISKFILSSAHRVLDRGAIEGSGGRRRAAHQPMAAESGKPAFCLARLSRRDGQCPVDVLDASCEF